MGRSRCTTWLGGCAAAIAVAATARAAPQPPPAEVTRILTRTCHGCHAGDTIEAEVDLATFATPDELRRRVRVWQRVAEVVADGQMPPREAEQPTAAERATLRAWLAEFLAAEAAAFAGDPGRVVLRRLDNAEYTFTLRDLTGVAALDPAREFPVDGAAGEGFTNTGQSLVMSPALVDKYLDAAKEVATHAVPLPDGLRFSAGSTRADFTNEILDRIRSFYRRYTVSRGDVRAREQQGIPLDPGHEGFIPTDRYVAAALAARDALRSGSRRPEEVAADDGLVAPYLALVWRTLETPPAGSLLLDRMRTRWREAAGDPRQAAAEFVRAEIAPWQDALWTFNPVGQIGRQHGRPDGPAEWMEPVTPIVARREWRIKLAAADGQPVTVRLATNDGGDGTDGDIVVWEHPRLVAAGVPDVSLKDLRPLVAATERLRTRLVRDAAGCLAAAAEAEAWAATADPATPAPAPAELAARHGVDADVLEAWLEALGLTAADAALPEAAVLMTSRVEKLAGHDAINGWSGGADLSVIANASDTLQRVPGTVKPHGLVTHPMPDRRAVIAWVSPGADTVAVQGAVWDAHVGCGNGVAWSVELRRGRTAIQLAAGVADNREEPVAFGPVESLAVRRGDRICLVVSPRGDHACDTTGFDLVVRAADGRVWDAAADLSGDILAGNPHADSLGNADVWRLEGEPVAGAARLQIPAGSLLARWQTTPEGPARQALADAVATLVRAGPASDLPADAADRQLHRELTAPSGAILSRLLAAAPLEPVTGDGPGPDPALFGRHPAGGTVAPHDLCVAGPGVVTFTLPAEFAVGRELVVAATLHPDADGSVQAEVFTGDESLPPLSPGRPFIARDGGAARGRIEAACAEFRGVFPPAACYGRLVPVDEVVTLNMFYREDAVLRRLMLDDGAAAEIDRLWDELLFVSQEPLRLVDAHEQLVQFATQDRAELVGPFEAMRAPLAARAEAFRRRLVDAEPPQVEAVVDLAARAWRRPLEPAERTALIDLYAALRRDGLGHDDAWRMLLARVFVAPAFLYKLETPGAGDSSGPVADRELATRLSYFLWSSLPDEPLAAAAAAGTLHEPDTIRLHARRMIADPRIRRLAEQFGTHWLHVHGFDRNDEKSPEAFPEFADLRGSMHEEAVLLLVDLFQNDRSILSLLDGDATFLDERLAAHYGIPGVSGPGWRRVDGVRQHGRGGVLTLAATLAAQSGASRTSPILRGNWLCEVLLGEKLPKPPKDVPPLAETVPATLTERELTALHSRDERCAGCHARIDPYGFALEDYDAIGRLRRSDAAGHAIDSTALLPDGAEVRGMAGLRDHLLATRADDFERQFCRKLLGFALGRSVQLSDQPLLDDIAARLAADDHRVLAAVEAIVASPQFLRIRGHDQTAPTDPVE